MRTLTPNTFIWLYSIRMVKAGAFGHVSCLSNFFLNKMTVFWILYVIG